MCGIVGYLGQKTKVLNVINVLEKLEYRGYDSAGVCCQENEKLTAVKSVGKIEKLKQKINQNTECASIIAHTRWATNGEVNTKNCHPHLSSQNIWAVVHNGIIENHQQIKTVLTHQPQSDTDTAVVSELLEQNNVCDICGFIETLNGLDGSFAIVGQCSKTQNTLFVAKRKSPLYLSKNKDGDVLIASDIICFADFSQTYFSLNDNEFAQVIDGRIEFFDSQCNQIQKNKHQIEDLFESVSKKHYNHFMIKEIEEQPQAIKNQVKYYQENQPLKIFNKAFVSRFNKVVLIGCGTAYHVGLMGAKYISKLTGLPACAEISSEFLYEHPVFVDEKTLCIFVSQSGETADTLGALAVAKKHNAFCVALTNVVYSSISKHADLVLPVCAGPEIAVASTKAYVCQLTALYIFASHIKNQLQNKNIDFYNKVHSLADTIFNFDKQVFDNLAEKIKTKRDVIFIGKGCDFITSQEASLKLKEVTYISSSSYPYGELKHGFLALVETGTPVFVIAGDKQTKSKTFNSASEAESRGADVFVISNEAPCKFSGCRINVDDELLFGVAAIVPLQYLAYKVAVAKGFNPDQPRNLAKSVTVE